MKGLSKETLIKIIEAQIYDIFLEDDLRAILNYYGNDYYINRDTGMLELYSKNDRFHMTEEERQTNINYCECNKTSYKDEYWGYWLECECGYKSNVDYAKYCGGCGKELRIIGVINNLEHYGER